MQSAQEEGDIPTSQLHDIQATQERAEPVIWFTPPPAVKLKGVHRFEGMGELHICHLRLADNHKNEVSEIINLLGEAQDMESIGPGVTPHVWTRIQNHSKDAINIQNSALTPLEKKRRRIDENSFLNPNEKWNTRSKSDSKADILSIIQKVTHVISDDSEKSTKMSDIMPESPCVERIPSTCVPTTGANLSLDTEYDIPSDLLDSDFENDVMEALNLEPAEESPKNYRRFLVLEVRDDIDSGRHCKILRLLDEVHTQEVILKLDDSWSLTEISIGDYVNVVADFSQPVSTVIVNDESNFIIVHPDTLISVTSLSESFSCVRRAVIKSRVKPPLSDRSSALVYGTMLHLVFQKSLQHLKFDNAFIYTQIDETVSKFMEDLYLIGASKNEAVEKMRQYAPTIQTWAKTYLDVSLLKQSEDDDGTTFYSELKITHVHDLEERIWSPMLGLKGNIDASISISMKNTSAVVAPLEIKTGKVSQDIAHRAQTTTYALLMKERYQGEIPLGLLCYLTAGETIRVQNNRDDIRNLIIGRNTLASHLQRDLRLPPVLQQPSICQRCFTSELCSIYHKSLESGTADSFGVGSLFDEKTGHMSALHCEFLRKWDTLISMEEGDMNRFKKEIWTLTSKQREIYGRCLSSMHLYRVQVNETGFTGVNNVAFEFRRCKWQTYISGSVSDTQISVGDPVIISRDPSPLALAVGFVTEITSDRIQINADKAILESAAVECDSKLSCNNAPLFRIDKDELQSGLGLIRSNILSLFTNNNKLCKLVVDLAPPQFTSANVDVFSSDFIALNPDQKQAILKVSSALDYALILGMPGTGKTTTITKLIKFLTAQGKSILLTSYTHMAVDNVLLKLKQEGLDFLRLGNIEKVHPAVRDHHLDRQKDQLNSITLEQFYNSKSIVATTCLGVGHPIFVRRRFDFCIVDEASQLTLPVSLGPLRFANTFVLVGDHYQLPPLVRNRQARENGFTLSLFKHLSEAHPDAVAQLSYQYRMNADIMELTNEFVYSHRLCCGNSVVSHMQLKLDHFELFMNQLHERDKENCQGSCWLRHVLSPRSVVFLDTDQLGAREVRCGAKLQNEIEAQLVFQLSDSLVHCGLQQDAIGVISPYRSQLKLISESLLTLPDIEVSTVDKYQGRDKECIIISLVRSNTDHVIGDLLRDWRRINVAFTRAKKKIIIIGSRSTLSNGLIFQDLFDFLEKRKWVYCLQPGDHLKHKWQVPLSQEVQKRSVLGRQGGELHVSCLEAAKKRNPIISNLL